MPSFTMELWRVIDLKPDNIETDTYLGLNDYPLFDPDYRSLLNEKIKNHFMYQEIGHETVDQFRFAMRRKMHEVMPLYNELYKTTTLEFDPLSTMDIHTVATGTSEQESEGTSASETNSNIDAKAKNVSSSFPQVQLAGNKDYATSGTDSNSQTETDGTASETSSATNTAASESDTRVTGYQGSPAQLIQQYRASLLNVDMLVIAELDELFMLIWTTGDEYSRTNGRYF